MKTKRSSKKPTTSTIMLVVIVVFSLIVGGKIFNQSGNDDLHTSPQETKPRSTPAVTVSAVATDPMAVPAANHSTANMKVTIYCRCSDYNHVGNEWNQYFNINDTRVTTGSRVAMEAGITIVVYTEIIEYDDAKDDIATCRDTVKITANDLEYGFAVTQTLQVKENGGRYTGNIAVWTVEYTFSPENEQ